MANLQGKKISNTYEGLIKTENNSAVSGATVLTDGAGNSLQITVNTDGTLTAQTITASNLNISNWNEAYSWGDHSLVGYATSSEIATAVNNVINSAPTALDTLDELAAALNDDANFATTITNLITGVSDRVTVLENAGFITTDTNTQLTDAEIAAMGYIKVDTNTQRTDAEIDARITLNPEGFITSYIDTNTQLTDAEIAAMGYIKTDTQLTDAEISALGYIKTDTNTQRTDAEIDARIALNPEGFITSYVDTNTQLSDADIAAMGYIKTDTNTQRSDAEINALIDANNFISDYTVTESDVTAHEGAITITESQISDLSHFSGSYDDLTDKPAGIIARSDEEIEDVIGAAISGSGATSVVYNDTAGTIVVSSTDTNTQLSDAEIAAFGYIKTDTNTQLSDADIAALGYIKVDTNTQLTDGEIAAFGYVKTDTQLTDSDIAAFGYIKTDTNTQRTDAEIQAIIDANSAGFITTYVDTNTQLSDADIAAMGYIKVDTNTQLSDSDIAALGYIKTDTNTQRTDAEINALITAGISGLATETYVDNAVSNLVDTAPTALDTLNELAAALGDDPNFATTVSTNIGNVSSRVTTLENANYISDYTVTEGDVTAHEAALSITESQISDLTHTVARTDAEIDTRIALNPEGFVTTDTNTQLSDSDIAAFGYIKTDTNTQRSDAEIIDVIEVEGFSKDALPLTGGTLTGDLEISGSELAVGGSIRIPRTEEFYFAGGGLNGPARAVIFSTDNEFGGDYNGLGFSVAADGRTAPSMYIRGTGKVGIGTTDPQEKLHVQNDTTGESHQAMFKGGSVTVGDYSYISLNNGYTTEYNKEVRLAAVSELTSSNKTGFAILTSPDSNGASGHERLRVTSDGDVGIGTDSPAAKLDVDEDGNSLALRVTGGGGGTNIASFVRDVGATGSSVNINAEGNSPQVQFASTTNTFSLGGDSSGNFKISDNTAIGTNDRITIDNTGYVGIGETAPDARLHIKDSNSGMSTFNSATTLIVESGGHNYVNICSGDTNRGELWFSDSAEGRGRLRYQHTSDTMEIWTAAGPKAYFYSTGNVTIAGSLTENSDISLKENITDIDNALDKVNSLRGVEYNMIADESKTKKIGFIAQEVEEVVPELVFDNEDVKSVAYSNTVALLVEAVKELTDKVSDLQGQIDAMRA